MSYPDIQSQSYLNLGPTQGGLVGFRHKKHIISSKMNNVSCIDPVFSLDLDQMNQSRGVKTP